MRARELLFTVLVNDFTSGNGANKLLAGVRIFTLNQALVLLAGDFAFQVPFLGQLAAPAALNFACFAVVILLGIGVLVPVIIECLLDGNWRGTHRHHGVNKEAKSETLLHGSLGRNRTQKAP